MPLASKSHLNSIAVAAVVMVLSGIGAHAQGMSGGASGTNSAGTANSSGSPTTTGSPAGAAGTGRTPDGAPSTGNAQVDAQDRAVDKKVKSICKGC